MATAAANSINHALKASKALVNFWVRKSFSYSGLSKGFQEQSLFDQPCNHETACSKFLVTKLTVEQISQIETINLWS